VSVTLTFVCAPSTADQVLFCLSALFAGIAAWGGHRLFARLERDPTPEPEEGK
jgi:hypothetical protein